MATDEQKKLNQVRLSNMALLSLAAGAWDVLGKGVNAFSGPMGDEILKAMEQEMGLEVAGEDPEAVMTEISRIFIDEYGFATDIEVVVKDNEHFQLKVKNCVNRNFTDKLMAAGVEKPFVCPIMNACRSALKRMGYRVHEDVEKWTEGRGSIISFTSV
jgi:ketopantoate reductase